MEQTLNVLYALAAIAIYEKLGVIEAMNYLVRQGYTREEAIDLIALYDHYSELCRSGQKDILMNSPKHAKPNGGDSSH